MQQRFKGNRYLTQGVVGKIDPVVQYGIWRYLDQFTDQYPWMVDYLQIFHLKTVQKEDGNYLIITHQQEIPEVICEEALVFKTEDYIDEKLYIISDVDEN